MKNHKRPAIVAPPGGAHVIKVRLATQVLIGTKTHGLE